MMIFVMLLIVAVALSRDTFTKSTAIPVSKDDKSSDKGNSTSDSGVGTIKDKSYQPESYMDSSLL